MLEALLVAAAWATPDARTLEGAWNAQRAAVQAGALQPVDLQAADFTRIAAGGVARRREPAGDVDRVIGATWSPLDRDALWIAILDDAHVDLARGLVEAQLPGTGPLRKVLYQHLDLPWPLADRQWVIDIRSNTALASRTAGAVWERAWTQADPAAAPSADPGALWTTINEGGWFLLDVQGGTLIVYHVRTEIGGTVPDDAITRWAMGTLEQMFAEVEARAAGMAEHYGPGHEPMVRPDGSTIPPGLHR